MADRRWANAQANALAERVAALVIENQSLLNQQVVQNQYDIENSSIASLSGTNSGEGASLVAIEDAAGYFSGDTVEDALAELGASVQAIGIPVQLKGSWDASSGSFPGSGNALAGWSYLVSGTGSVDSVPFTVGDRIIAITDNASTSTYASNWFKADYTDVVTSVDGLTGAVDLSGTYHPLMSQESAISDPAGGSTVDTEARSAIASILSALRSLGLIET